MPTVSPAQQISANHINQLRAAVDGLISPCGTASCSCAAWAPVGVAPGACGSGGCGEGEIQWTRTCTPAACLPEAECRSDAVCSAGCSPSCDECSLGETRSCTTTSGCQGTAGCVWDSGSGAYEWGSNCVKNPDYCPPGNTLTRGGCASLCFMTLTCCSPVTCEYVCDACGESYGSQQNCSAGPSCSCQPDGTCAGGGCSGGCSCGSWTTTSCQNGTRCYGRICTPSGCAQTVNCVADATCSGGAPVCGTNGCETGETKCGCPTDCGAPTCSDWCYTPSTCSNPVCDGVDECGNACSPPCGAPPPPPT